MGQPCGSIGVSQVPCYDRVFLADAAAGDFEFRVDDFDDKSDPVKCQPGGGEHFRLQSDGRLGYRTTYQPLAQGILERQ